MKTGGGFCRRLVVRRLIENKPGPCSLLSIWCRKMSSLQGTTVQKESAARPLEAQVLWGEFLADSSKWLDNRSIKRTSRYREYVPSKPKEAVLVNLDYTWFEGEVEPGESIRGSKALYRIDFDRRTDCEDSGRVATGEAAIKEEIWRELHEGRVSKAVEALDLLVQQAAYVPCSLLHRVLERCIKQKDVVLGGRVHALILASGHESNTFLVNHVIDLYASYGTLEEATQAFMNLAAPDSFSWCSIIRAYAEHGQHVQSINLYQQMQLSPVKATSYIYVAVLKACISTADLALGKQVHVDILRSKFECDVFVGSCLVDMYAKCGSVGDARSVFDRMPVKNVVTWAAMIAGYVHHGLGEEALTLFSRMQHQGMMPTNRVTFVCLLKACAAVGALHQGKQLHSQIQERGLGADMVVGNCLVDMYAKCGSLEDAQKVFDTLPARDVVTWTALLYGYAEHNYGHMALQLFERMQQEGVRPDQATFTCLLVACSKEGLVDEAQIYLKMMVHEYCIPPNVRHYTCLVDLLGRSGRLDQAEFILQSMPFENCIVGLTSLLSACKSHGDIERGRRCFDRLIELEPESATAYVLLENLYANVGRWKDVDRIETLRKAAGALKKPARASIEIHSKVKTFIVGEVRADITSKLRSVNMQMKQEGGLVPHTQLMRTILPEQGEENALCGHAEKLALAYGLLNSPEGTTLRVMKNLRMCNDCHISTKIMSRLERREIIVRDAHRVHHFVDGSCSCGDRM